MTFIPIASFLAGALLSLLLPACLLIALAIWHLLVIRRVPGAAEGSGPARPENDPAPSAPPELERPSGQG